MVTRWWPKNTNPFCEIFRSLKWKRRDLYCARNKPKRNLSGLTWGRFGCLCPEWCWSAWRSTRPQRNYICRILEVFEPVLASVLVVPNKLVSPPKKSTSQNGVRSIFSDDGVAPVAVWGADPAQVMSSQWSPIIWIFKVICIFSSARWCLCNYLNSFCIFCIQYGVLSALSDVITMSSKYSINYVYFLFRTSVDVIAVIFILSVFAVLSERSMISSIICIFSFIWGMRSCQYWNIEAMSICYLCRISMCFLYKAS